MKKKHVWIYYLLAWLGYCIYVWVDNLLNARGATPYVWSNLAAAFIQFSFCFFVVYPRFLSHKHIQLLIGGLLAAEGLFIGARYFIEEVLYVWILGHGNYDADTTTMYYLKDNWWRALQPVLLSFIIWAFLDTFQKEKETEQLRREKTQAELAFLRSQINPHFLYNSLNYIYALAYPVSEQLASAIIKLSGVMRYMLMESSSDRVALQNEVDYLHNYIDIYRLRFEDHFFVDLRISQDISQVRVASLLLIPFVENAFKHGVVNDPECPVSMHLQADPSRLLFTVRNKINQHQKDVSSGIGMSNVRRRLELLYPGRHTLHITNDGNIYSAILQIDLKPLK